MKKIILSFPVLSLTVLGTGILGCGSGDLGNTGITTEQAVKMQEQQVERIENNPNIPPQAKAAIKAQIEMGKSGGGGPNVPPPK